MFLELSLCLVLLQRTAEQGVRETALEIIKEEPKRTRGPGTTGTADNHWKVNCDERKIVTETDNHFKIAIYLDDCHFLRK